MPSSSFAQEQLLPFLEDPASYPHEPASVEILQTHASYVAIAPPYVYKVKKAVDLGFLDFSTLERRKHFCEEEVRLNRRLCTEIYRGVVPISKKGSGLTWGPGEEVVEYAVEMRKLEDGRFLHQLLEEEDVAQAGLEPVIERLARFYREQQPTPEVTAWGRIERLKISTDENFDQTEGFAREVLPQPTYRAIRFYTDRFYDRQAALLARRPEEGRILDCHGDLHTEHIHLSPRGVCIYDCIEFNERFRYIDVANDIAFLAMDLDYHERPDLARYAAEGLAERLGDPDILRLLDFYKCYRAYVRGKVEGIRSSESEVPEEERQRSRERARRYFSLALRYAVAGSAPFVVVVMGRPGTGKTTQAEALAELLGWEVVSSDRTRKGFAGVPLYSRGDAEARARLYAPSLTERTYAALRKEAAARAQQGQSTILDATFSRPEDRAALQEALRTAEVPCAFVELIAPDTALRERLRRREEAAEEVVSDARLEDFDMLAARYLSPQRREGLLHLAADAEQSSEATTLQILEGLICLEGSLMNY